MELEKKSLSLPPSDYPEMISFLFCVSFHVIFLLSDFLLLRLTKLLKGSSPSCGNPIFLSQTISSLEASAPHLSTPVCSP